MFPPCEVSFHEINHGPNDFVARTKPNRDFPLRELKLRSNLRKMAMTFALWPIVISFSGPAHSFFAKVAKKYKKNN